MLASGLGRGGSDTFTPKRKQTPETKAICETLENRQLLSVTIDVRAADGSKTVDVSAIGQVVNLEVWAVITGKNGDPTQDGLADVAGSFLSTGFGSGSVAGNLAGTLVNTFTANGANPGEIQDLNNDGNLDLGSNDPNATPFGFFFARAGYMVGPTDPAAVIHGPSLEFKLETLTYTVTHLNQGGETQINFRDPPVNGELFTALWSEDGKVAGGSASGIAGPGTPVIISDSAIAPAPSAVASSFYVQQNTTGSLTPLIYDSSVNSFDPTKLIFTTPTTHGTTALQPDGSLLYTPSTGFIGTDSFVYTISDIKSLTSNPATVTIHVTASAPPVAANMPVAAVVNVPQNINVLSGATKAPGSTLIPALVALVTATSHGTAIPQPDGSILYTPAKNFVGGDQFQYTITDSNHDTSNIATVSITVAPTLPPYAAQYAVNVTENTPLDFSILPAVKSQSGIPIDPVTTAISQGANHGTAIVQPDGTILYTPTHGFLGEDWIEYSIRDLNGIKSNDTVLYINVIVPPPPVAVGAVYNTYINTPITISVLIGDYAVTLGATLDPTSVAVTTASVSGKAVAQSNGTVVYNPTPGFTGTDSFTYTVKDSIGNVSNQATIIVYINNRIPPIAGDDSALVSPGNSVNIPVLANDSASVGATINPALVTLFTMPTHGTAIVQSNGSVLYTPASGFKGVDSFQYTVADNFGIVSTPATVNVTVTQQLTGKVIGTAGSYRNHGTTIANVFDGNLSTFFDGPTASGNWVGLDLGTPTTIQMIRFAPRPGWESRMVGGAFQASNDRNFKTGVVALAAILMTAPAGQFTTLATTTPGAYRYVRYLSPANSYGNVAEIQFAGFTATSLVPLTGTFIGTPGSYLNKGNTIANAFDANLATFVDAPTADGNWVGLDLGTAQTISQISYAPRAGWASRMIGGIFQASNSANFSSGVVVLNTVSTNPAIGVLTTVPVTVTTGTYRYVRYLSPNGSYGNIAEMAFYG